jgi:hypothetical protein
MSFQAVIRDGGGTLLTNTQLGIRISIIEGSLPGTLVYQEIQTPVTNKNGLVTLEIGGENGFDAINWGSDIHFIKTETDPAGGTNYTLSGISQMLSVPYAFFAGKVQTVSGRFCYRDKDGDGFGDVYSPLWIPADVNVPNGYVFNREDCNDLDLSIHPGAAEICGDGIDQNCDGSDLICVMHKIGETYGGGIVFYIADTGSMG